MVPGATSAHEPTIPKIVRVSTDAGERHDRTSLMGDVIARELTGAAFSAPDGDARCNWTLSTLAPGTVLGYATQGGFSGLCDSARAHDGDTDLSIFLGIRDATPFEQNDRRSRLSPDTAMLVAPGRPVQSWWSDSEVMILRLPRAALHAADRIEAAGGVLLGPTSPARRLLAGYAAALWPLLCDGTAGEAQERRDFRPCASICGDTMRSRRLAWRRLPQPRAVETRRLPVVRGGGVELHG